MKIRRTRNLLLFEWKSNTPLLFEYSRIKRFISIFVFNENQKLKNKQKAPRRQGGGGGHYRHVRLGY